MAGDRSLLVRFEGKVDPSLTNAAAKTEDTIRGAADRSAGFMAGIGAAAGTLMARGLEIGISKAVEFGQASITAFREADAAQRQLVDAYARFPAMADLNIDALRDLNQAIQDKTGADADDLAAAQASLGQYRLTGQQIAQLTPLLDDYAVKTGKDLPTAADELGKAMLGQGRALKGVGIDFEDAGSVGKNFEQVMSGLRSQVGGFAESEAPTAEGQMRQLQARFGDVQEDVGKRLTPVLLALGDGLLNEVLPAAQKFGDGLGGIFDLLTKGDYTGSLSEAFGIEEDSEVVAFLFEVRDTLVQVGDAASEFWAGLTMDAGVRQEFEGQLDGLTAVGAGVRDVLEKAGGAVGDFLGGLKDTAEWVVDNEEWLTPLGAGIAVMVGGMVAFNIQQTIATGGGMIAWLTKMVTATNLYTAAHWLLNIALHANPIGLVVLALTALGVGLAVAWNKSETFRNIVTGAWEGIKSAAGAVTDWFTKTAWPAITGFLDGIGNGFRVAVDTIGGWWNGLKDKVMQPVKWIADNVVNPLLAGVEKVGSVFGVSLTLPRLALASGGVVGVPSNASMYADGGVMPGYTPGRDVHRFVSPTGGLLDLSGGEAVMRPEFTAAVGAGWVDRMNAAARAGGIAGVQGELFGKAKEHAFAAGGIIPNSTQGFAGYDPAALAAMKAWASATGLTWSMTGAGGARTYEQQWALYQRYLAGGNLAADPRKGLGPHMMPAIAMDLSPRPGENPAAAGMLRGFGLGLTVPGEPWHISYLAGRGGGVTPGGGLDIAAMVKDAIGQVLKISGAGVFGDILNAIPPKLIGWGVDALTGKLFDGGGMLPPGLNVVENRTGSPEPVLTTPQWDRLTSAATGQGIDVEQLAAAVASAVREAVADALAGATFVQDAGAIGDQIMYRLETTLLTRVG